MKDELLKQASHEYSPGNRLKALVIEGVVFLGLLPAALVYFSGRIDDRFTLPTLGFGVIAPILGAALVAAGLLLGWWSVYVQFTIGRGTPVPIMATQQLITQRPYSYCRNPMALGAIVAYLGVGVLVGSLSAVVLVLAFAVVLLTYIKLLEEREMELRFGDAYREYRRRTPFIIPRFRRGQ